MDIKEPWSEKWRIRRAMGGGGQGATSIVESASVPQKIGVLKVLRWQDEAEARRRMFQEVGNLKVLENAKIKVPAILDSNTNEFESDVPLYFVMEYVAGNNLADSIRKSGRLPLDIAVGLCIDLAKTIEAAHAQNVLHRDIKPENIVIGSLNPPDAFIVDYGLSFNSENHGNVTRVSETLDNNFLSLPERRVPGGNRRDPRSDLVGICGLLFYCLTGESPVDLIDSDGRPPHRRPGRTLQESLPDESRLQKVEAFLDRGFSTVMDARFQTPSELVMRLTELLAFGTPKSPLKPAEFAKASAQLLLKQDRTTQLHQISQCCKPVLGEMQKHLGMLTQSIHPYMIGYQTHSAEMGRPENVELIPLPAEETLSGHTIRITMRNHTTAAYIMYVFGAFAVECTLYRRIAVTTRKDGRDHWRILTDWIPVFRFDGLITPKPGPAIEDIDMAFVEAMQEVESIILKSK